MDVEDYKRTFIQGLYARKQAFLKRSLVNAVFEKQMLKYLKKQNCFIINPILSDYLYKISCSQKWVYPGLMLMILNPLKTRFWLILRSYDKLTCFEKKKFICNIIGNLKNRTKYSLPPVNSFSPEFLFA